MWVFDGDDQRHETVADTVVSELATTFDLNAVSA
jgi:hypothetical protein